MKKPSLIFLFCMSLLSSKLALACDNTEAGVDFLAQDEYRIFSKIKDVGMLAPYAADYLFARISGVQICKAKNLEGVAQLQGASENENPVSVYKEGTGPDDHSVDLLVAAVLTKNEMYLNTDILDENQIFKVIAKELIPGEDLVNDRKARALGNLLNRAGKMNAGDFNHALTNLKVDFKPVPMSGSYSGG